MLIQRWYSCLRCHSIYKLKICLDMRSRVCNEHLDAMIKSPNHTPYTPNSTLLAYNNNSAFNTFGERTMYAFAFDAHSASIIIINVLCISRITSCAIHKLHKLTHISVWVLYIYFIFLCCFYYFLLLICLYHAQNTGWG